MENLDCLVCLEGAREPVLCPKCSKVFCFPCIRGWFDSSNQGQKGCPHCKADIAVNTFVKVKWLQDLAKQMAPSIADKCETHPSKQKDHYCSDCMKSFCYDCFKTHHPDGDVHTMTHVEAAFELDKMALDRRLREAENFDIAPSVIHIQTLQNDIEKLQIDGNSNIDQMANQMKKSLTDTVRNFSDHVERSKHMREKNATFSRLSEELVEASKSPMRNQLVDLKQNLIELGRIADELLEVKQESVDLPRIPSVQQWFALHGPDWRNDIVRRQQPQQHELMLQQQGQQHEDRVAPRDI